MWTGLRSPSLVLINLFVSLCTFQSREPDNEYQDIPVAQLDLTVPLHVPGMHHLVQLLTHISEQTNAEKNECTNSLAF